MFIIVTLQQSRFGKKRCKMRDEACSTTPGPADTHVDITNIREAVT